MKVKERRDLRLPRRKGYAWQGIKERRDLKAKGCQGVRIWLIGRKGERFKRERMHRREGYA